VQEAAPEAQRGSATEAVLHAEWNLVDSRHLRTTSGSTRPQRDREVKIEASSTSTRRCGAVPPDSRFPRCIRKIVLFRAAENKKRPGGTLNERYHWSTDI